jgi:flotillin
MMFSQMFSHWMIVVGLMVLATLMLISMLARLYQKAGPNEAIIRFGFGGPQVIIGHGALVYPVVQHTRTLSLELMSFDVAPQQDLYTKQGVAVR